MSKAMFDTIAPDLNEVNLHAKNLWKAQNAYVAYCLENPDDFNGSIGLEVAAEKASEQTIQYLCSVLEWHGLGKAVELAGEIQTHISNKGSNGISWYPDFGHFASEGAYYPNAYIFIDVLDQFQRRKHIILDRAPRSMDSPQQRAKMLQKKRYLDRIVMATGGFLACEENKKEDKMEAATALLSLMRMSSGAQSPWLYEIALAFKSNPDLLRNGMTVKAKDLRLMFTRVAQNEAEAIGGGYAFHPQSFQKDMAFLIEALHHFCEQKPNDEAETSLIGKVFRNFAKTPEAKEAAAELCDALAQASGASRDFISSAKKALNQTTECAPA